MTLNEISKVFVIIHLLFRFFSPEVLAQAQSGSAPAMPPLPTQKVIHYFFVGRLFISCVLKSQHILDPVHPFLQHLG